MLETLEELIQKEGYKFDSKAQRVRWVLDKIVLAWV